MIKMLPYSYLNPDLRIARDRQYQDICISDTNCVILLYQYQYRFSVSPQYQYRITFVHGRYKYLDTVFEREQSYHVLTVCSLTVSKECENKLKLKSLTTIYYCFITLLNDGNCEIGHWNIFMFCNYCPQIANLLHEDL